MKNYTREERADARKKLTRPVNDFLSSDALLDIYRGIFKKHKLNFYQGGLVSEIANVTLMGLEPESALETNLHQTLPALSSDTMRELAADINDRLFKEARRRVQENIVTPEPVWDEEELGKKPAENSEPLLTDEELEALAEKEAKEGWTPPIEPDESAADVVPQNIDGKVGNIEIPIEMPPTQSVVAEKLGGVVVGKPEEKVQSTEFRVPSAAPGGPSSEFQAQSPESGTTSSESRVQSPELITKNSELGTQNVSIPAPLPPPVKPTEQVVTPPPPLAPAAEVKKYPDKVDPYREPIE